VIKAEDKLTHEPKRKAGLHGMSGSVGDCEEEMDDREQSAGLMQNKARRRTYLLCVFATYLVFPRSSVVIEV
jgi:hypothetical protein